VLRGAWHFITSKIIYQITDYKLNFMNTIRWIRVILSSIFIVLGLAFGTYFYIKEHRLISIAPQGCFVRVSPNFGNLLVKSYD
jgi:hypothetical protein